MGPSEFSTTNDSEKQELPRITKPITGAIKVLRNAPCLCGSGVKAKRCCLPKLQRRDAENRRTVI